MFRTFDSASGSSTPLGAGITELLSIPLADDVFHRGAIEITLAEDGAVGGEGLLAQHHTESRRVDDPM